MSTIEKTELNFNSIEYGQDKLSKIVLIHKYMSSWWKRLNTLPTVLYRSSTIQYKDINMFVNKKRCDNDKNNKNRENIIGCVINNKIPIEYYKYSNRWNTLKKTIASYIEQLAHHKEVQECNQVTCIHKAGRDHHYDFQIILNTSVECNIEFKFNASDVQETPQFVSPMKPSQYLESSYEDFYYDNYFSKLFQEGNQYNLSLPPKDDYMKQIHSTNPNCLKTHQDKYYRGCKKSSKFSGEENDIQFYKTMKKLSKDSIFNFITQYNIKYEQLSEYLLHTQKDKCYMLYKDNKIYFQTINQDNYLITEVTKQPKYDRYVAKTKTGKSLKILLRWKNGNGIAYPAFQIS